MGKTKEDRINTVMNGGGQVVILGAGASIASTLRNPEINGKKLPSMDNFIDVVGLHDLVEKVPNELLATNFEDLYSNLYNYNPNYKLLTELEKRVYLYFSDMHLPKVPTIYDYLVLSLRSKDLIATFNWDPFLYQAWSRISLLTDDLPYLSFLHGNVAIGYDEKIKRAGPSGYRNYKPTKLLYPIGKKNYNDDEFIKTEWDRLKYWLKSKSTKLVTIFGYGAPKSDIEAINLMNEAWGGNKKRSMEQFEIIDKRDEDTVRNTWKAFIHSHHYDYGTSYFDSSLANNPRRTSESYFQHILPMSPDEAFSESNPVPNNFEEFESFFEWHQPLLDAEMNKTK